MVPIIALFDILAAFPSLGHPWLFATLRHLGLPQGLLNYALLIYTNVAAYGFNGNLFSFLFWVVSGVLQGCPLAGTFFAIALDPFLRHLASLIDDEKLGHSCSL